MISFEKIFKANHKTMGIRSLIENPTIDLAQLAYILFPSNIHPKKALARVSKGDKALDKIQLERLAVYLAVDVSKLFSATDWQNFNRENAVCFTYKNKLISIDLFTDKAYAYEGKKDPVFFELSETFTDLIKAIVNTKLD